MRPHIEYAATVWDPHISKQKHSLEMVHRRAARWVTNRYHNTSSVSDMLHTLGWRSLEHRRATSRLCMLFQIYHGSIGIPHDPYILPYYSKHRPLFHMCSLEVKNVLFRTFCTPLYTCQLWSRYTARSLHKLYVAYNNAFRMMHHLPTYCSASEMFTVNRVPNCAAVIRNLTFKFMSRLGLSSNALVCSIIDSDLKCVSRIRLHWMNMLYIHFDGG